MSLSAVLNNSPALTAAQIYTLARQAGFPSSTATTMTAVAMRESNGYPGAYNGTGLDNSYGLWQINLKDPNVANLMAQNGITNGTQLLDPATNAQAAALLWGGNDANLNPAWYINRDGYRQAYEKYLPLAQEAANTVEGTGASDGQDIWAGGADSTFAADLSGFGNLGTMLILGAAVLLVLLLTKRRQY